MGADPKRQAETQAIIATQLHVARQRSATERLRAHEETLSWLNGYIQALEELLRETSLQRPGEVERGLKPKQKAARWNNWFGAIAMWKSWRRVAGHKLHVARLALASLEEKGGLDDGKQGTC